SRSNSSSQNRSSPVAETLGSLAELAKLPLKYSLVARDAPRRRLRLPPLRAPVLDSSRWGSLGPRRRRRAVQAAVRRVGCPLPSGILRQLPHPAGLRRRRQLHGRVDPPWRRRRRQRHDDDLVVLVYRQQLQRQQVDVRRRPPAVLQPHRLRGEAVALWRQLRRVVAHRPVPPRRLP
ncbi:Os12g0595800, partial [Oryza sativa Japonica Group]